MPSALALRQAQDEGCWSAAPVIHPHCDSAKVTLILSLSKGEGARHHDRSQVTFSRRSSFSTTRAFQAMIAKAPGTIPVPVPRQVRQRFIVERHQRFLLGARPALYLPFPGNGVENAIIGFGKHQLHRTARLGVTLKNARIVLPHTRFNRLLGQSGVIRAIRASQDIDRGFHRASRQKKYIL